MSPAGVRVYFRWEPFSKDHFSSAGKKKPPEPSSYKKRMKRKSLSRRRKGIRRVREIRRSEPDTTINNRIPLLTYLNSRRCR